MRIEGFVIWWEGDGEIGPCVVGTLGDASFFTRRSQADADLRHWMDSGKGLFEARPATLDVPSMPTPPREVGSHPSPPRVSYPWGSILSRSVYSQVDEKPAPKDRHVVGQGCDQ
ncbi:MAG: hypothetical protein WDA27_15400 [Actinomycetota bacterium]